MLRNLAARIRGPRRRGATVAALALAAVLLGLTGYHFAFSSTAQAGTRAFPQNAAMEDQLGIRFSRVAVVGDGGLVTVTYVVLDSEKAARFQAGTKTPPVLISESRTESTKRVSLMKQGHGLRPGQTYYLVYQNTRAALRSGESATIVEGDVQLPHVPVL